jgi:hypothetical protein
VLRVECTKCSRKGVYYLHRLIEKHGRKGNMMKWKELLNGDCPRRDAQQAAMPVTTSIPSHFERPQINLDCPVG